jgi:hypothetical protein
MRKPCACHLGKGRDDEPFERSPASTTLCYSDEAPTIVAATRSFTAAASGALACCATPVKTHQCWRMGVAPVRPRGENQDSPMPFPARFQRGAWDLGART